MPSVHFAVSGAPWQFVLGLRPKMGVLPVCILVHYLRVYKRCQYLGTGVRASREPSCETCESNLHPPEEQLVLFISPASGVVTFMFG